VWILVIVGVVLLALGGGLLWSGRMTQHLVNAMKQAIPTSANKIGEAFPGEMISISGKAGSDNPLISEHGKVPCLYYSSSVERDYETTEYTSGTKNSPSRRTTRRVTETVSSNTQSTSFYIEDETGRVQVIPDDAEFDARETLNRFESASGINGTSISIGGFNIGMGDGDRTIGYRYKESVIPIDQSVYVVGVVNEAGEIQKPGRGQDKAALIVSYRTEKALIDDWQDSARWQAYGSIGSVGVGIALLIAAVFVAIM
jgi:hypothetical protein